MIPIETRFSYLFPILLPFSLINGLLDNQENNAKYKIVQGSSNKAHFHLFTCSYIYFPW